MRRLPLCAAFCAIALCTLAATPPEDEDDNPNAVRPTGVSHRHSSKHRHRATAKKEEPEDVPIVTNVPGVVPNTAASSAIVIDAHSGEVLYEKNADQYRQPASTQKLLTALIIA
jgi:D-alanyl-D-alanine carboxypeptidase